MPQARVVEAAVIFFDLFGVDSGTISMEVLTNKPIFVIWMQSNHICIGRQTCTSFSFKSTFSTITARAALFGFGFCLYSASRMAWSLGLETEVSMMGKVILRVKSGQPAFLGLQMTLV
jgi:hypothetical protein